MKIGVDLGGTKIEVIALGEDGRQLVRRRWPTPQGDYDAIVRTVATAVAFAESETGGQPGRATVGIGTPGALRPGDDTLKNSNTACLNGRPLRADLVAALGRPVVVANDADCFALSEATDGAGAGAASVFGVILGTGVGGGLVVQGRLLGGPNAICGEWGHTPLPWPTDAERPGPACACGRHGCVETWLSGPGLRADHRHVTGLDLDAEAIAAAAAAGDRSAIETLSRWEQRLARALTVVLDIFDPHVVVLGGGLSNLPGVCDRLPAAIAPWVFSDDLRTRFVTHRHGDSSGVRGAAWLGAAAD
jgi:fructokinase